jgi:hypothetical protein
VMKKAQPPKIRKTPSIVPQPRHPATGQYQPKGTIYKPQAMPYMPSSTDGQ